MFSPGAEEALFYVCLFEFTISYIYILYRGRKVYHIYAFPSFPFTVRAVALAWLYQSLKKKLHLLLVVVARWLGRLNSRLIQKQWQQSSIVELQVLALGIVLIAVIVASIVQWCGVVEQELSKQPFGGNICDMSSSSSSIQQAAFHLRTNLILRTHKKIQTAGVFKKLHIGTQVPK